MAAIFLTCISFFAISVGIFWFVPASLQAEMGLRGDEEAVGPCLSARCGQ